MKILALDLGSNTGWVSGIDSKILKYEGKNWIHKTKTFTNESFLEFFHWLYPMAKNFNKIVVERPNGGMEFHANRVLFGMYGIVQMVCASWNIEMVHVGATEIKKFWTGNGKAGKPDMLEQASKRGFLTNDHNVADALAIYTYYMEVLRGKSEYSAEESVSDSEDYGGEAYQTT